MKDLPDLPGRLLPERSKGRSNRVYSLVGYLTVIPVVCKLVVVWLLGSLPNFPVEFQLFFGYDSDHSTLVGVLEYL